MVSEKVEIDAFISSPAKRAKKTAQLFVHEFLGDKEKIILIPDLYNAPRSVFQNIIPGLDKSYHSVAIFAHNPGVTDFANSLTDFRIADMPTCGVFAIKIHSDTWEDFETAEKEFWFFNYPKLKG